MKSIEASRQSQPDPAVLATELEVQHVADIAELLHEQSPKMVAAIVAHLPFDVVVDILDHPQFKGSAALLQRLPNDEALAFLAAMSADRAADLLRHLGEPTRSHLLGRLDEAARISLEQLLSYLSDTAGSLMTTEFVNVPATWTVERTLQHVRNVERSRETVMQFTFWTPHLGI